MGKPTGFKEYNRELPSTRPVKDRLNDFKELYEPHPEQKTREQAARCMDCGVPFCHTGCPLGNIIPDFNDAVYQEDWESAYKILTSTNNFPEFTGRICPAPCESSCVLGINKPPVSIEHIEKSIIETAFEKGYVVARPPKRRTDKTIAIIGSGPAGLAAASQLNQAGHNVTVFERDDKIGGLLRYGIPDFKMEKWVVDRRIDIMREEGIIFRTNVHAGVDISGEELQKEFDAIMLCGGATVPRDLPVVGRELNGVHFAMDFLWRQNKEVSDGEVKAEDITQGRPDFQKHRETAISAKNKHVVVIGGGDTGSDCIGTSNRQGAKSVRQIELLEKPPLDRSPENPWPEWPKILRTSSSHEEGVERFWAIQTKAFVGNEKGDLTGIQVVEIEWEKPEPGKRPIFKEVIGSEEIWPCDLALLAIGFTGPEKNGIIGQLGLEITDHGLPKTKRYQSSIENVFIAGDMRRGQSLVVWAISEGREAARAMDKYLMGTSSLPAKDESMYQVNA